MSTQQPETGGIYAGKTESDNTALQFGVPQGSVLGTRVFVQYAEDVGDIFRHHGVHHRLFADDMQSYCSGRLNDVPAIVSWLENCIVDIYAWCGAKRLQLNADKTELLWFGPASQLRHLPSQNSTIHVNQCVVKPVTVVRDLACGSTMSYHCARHVSRVTQTCFCHLRRIHAIRRQLGRDVTAKLVTAIVLSRMDYCNAMLACSSPARSGKHRSGS